jgi:hypothetical protein
MKTPEHNHYLIKLSNGRYLCYENSNTACIYRATDLNEMRYDLNITGGELVALTSDRKIEIFVGVGYDNKDEGIDAAELLEELRGMSRHNDTLVKYETAL